MERQVSAKELGRLHRMRIVVVICTAVLLVAGCARPATWPARTANSTATVPATETSPASTATPTIAETLPASSGTPTMTETPRAPDATATPKSALTAAGVVEVPVTEIPLSGPLVQRSAEVSGLAWYGDYLILLPQYPDFSVQEGNGAVYALPRVDLLAWLDGATAGPLQPVPVPFVAPGLADQVDGYEGYEAIAFLGGQAFLTIEADTAGGMRAYLVTGQIAPDLSALTLDTASLTEIPPQSAIENKSDEALFVAGDRLVTIYEVNGASVNPSPLAHLFDTSLAPAGTIPFPQIEYRITDATALDSEGRFWAINYFFPGDTELRPERDPLAERYGWGPTHTPEGAVERLVEFQYAGSGIDLVDRPPIQLELPGDVLGGLGRNWEGLVRLDGRGFLLMTDMFPDTILAFVSLPEGE